MIKTNGLKLVMGNSFKSHNSKPHWPLHYRKMAEKCLCIDGPV